MENSDFQNMVVNFLHEKGFDDIIKRFMMSSKVQEMANEKWAVLQQNINGIQNSAAEAHYGTQTAEIIRNVLRSYTYEMYQSDLQFGAQMMVYGMIQGLLELSDKVDEEEVNNAIKKGLIEETQAMLKGMNTINDTLIRGTIEDAGNIVLGITIPNSNLEDLKMGSQKVGVIPFIIKQVESEN